MNLQKGIILVVLGFWVYGAPTFTDAQVNHEAFNYKALLKTASQKGLVRVMVEMDVPGIQELTTYSSGFKTGERKRFSSQLALDADLELDRAISATRDEVLLQLNGTNYHINRTYATIPAMALSCSPEALQRLVSVPGVWRVFEDTAVRLPKIEEDISTRTDEPDKALLVDSTHIIGADEAWSYGYAGSGWYVAILDTGILRSHDMFSRKNLVEQCYSQGEFEGAGGQGGCPNGRTEMSGPGAAAHYQTRFFHGSHVAGIAAGNDGNTHFGVARDAGIIAVQVFTYFSDEDDVLSWSSDQLKGLEYIYLIRNNFRIAAVNMSLGGGEYSSYCSGSSRAQIIANLRAAGIATVVASGNDGNCNGIGDPACVPGAIAVNGTNKQDTEYFWGNWSNALVSLMAPGQSINSAMAGNNSSYGNASGTSMATPHVTGAWAILKSFDETLTVDHILTYLKETGLPISSSHCSGNTPKPRIDVGKALRKLLSIAPPQNPLVVQVSNEAFLQLEYINVLTWNDNPRNADKNIAYYRVYQMNGNQETLLAEVPATIHTYWDRHVEKRVATTYGFSSIDANGEESIREYYALTF